MALNKNVFQMKKTNFKSIHPSWQGLLYLLLVLKEKN